METGLRGKVAIVTGGALGLGRGITIALAKEGVQTVVADIRADEAGQVVDQVRSSGGRALAIPTDVSRSDQVQAMVDQVIEQFGRIDILVNNAGIVGPQGPWVALTEEGFDRVIGVNLKGVWLCSKAVIPHMTEKQNGKIIHIASVAAKTGEEFNGLYAATKAAVQSMTQSMAAELGRHNINVNAVCPGAMPTELMETVYRERSQYFGLEPEELRTAFASRVLLPRPLTVEAVAGVVVFVASQQADMMTGQAVNTSGGLEFH